MNLLIRADASTHIGTGHVMRCIALAQAWKEAGGRAIFAIANPAPAIEERLRTEGLEIIGISAPPGSAEDARKTADLALQVAANWVVLDGYHFGAEYQKIVKASGQNLLFVEDSGRQSHYYADLILDQNVCAREDFYVNREAYTQLLLGTRYALLRREFWAWRGWKRPFPVAARKILVTLGGSDRDNVTSEAIRALQRVETDNLEAVVVVGGSNPHYEQLQAVVGESRFPIRLERNATNMPELMAWADVAIAAGGSTSWELAFMGLPSLVVILADNQQAIAHSLGELEIAINLGWHADVTVEKMAEAIGQLLASTEARKTMSQRAQNLVDGEGSFRVAMQLESSTLKLRRGREDDCKLLWKWANEPEVRAVSFSSELIPWERHVQWFNSKLSASDCIFYIAVNNNDVPIGQVRYDIETEEAVISISIDRKFRDRGYGSSLILLASDKLFRESAVTRINAYIKLDNQASIRAFVKAGFQSMGTTTVRGISAIHLVKNRAS